MKDYSLLIASLTLVAVSGLSFFLGALLGIDAFRESAIKHGAARYVIDNPATGATRFEWINPEVEK